MGGWIGTVDYEGSEILFNEFRAWLDCDGLAGDRLLHRREAEKITPDDYLPRLPPNDALHRPASPYPIEIRQRQLQRDD